MESLGDEELYELAVAIVLIKREATIPFLQRRLKIGYARAETLIDMLEERGVVGLYRGLRPRIVIVDPDDFQWQTEDTRIPTIAPAGPLGAL